MAANEPASNDIEQLFEQARQGSQEAAQLLFDRYGRRVLERVRQRLHFPLRRVVDSFDIVQEVRVELCVHSAPPGALHSAPAFLAYLCVLAHRKVSEARRHFETQGRDLGRDLPLEQLPADSEPAVQDCDDLAERESWDLFEAGLPPVYRRIWVLLRAGQSQAEIADELGIGERTVRRIVSKLRSLSPPRKLS